MSLELSYVMDSKVALESSFEWHESGQVSCAVSTVTLTVASAFLLSPTGLCSALTTSLFEADVCLSSQHTPADSVLRTGFQLLWRDAGKFYIDLYTVSVTFWFRLMAFMSK